MKLFTISFLFFFSLTAATSGSGMIPLRTYTTDDGLVFNEVTCNLQDSKGYLWFGTYAGISRFDGKNFRNYSEKDSGLGGSIIRSITEDAQGNIWVGYTGGIARLSGNQFICYKEGLLGTDVVNLWPDPKKGLWVLSGEGVSYYDPDTDTFRTYTLDGIETGSFSTLLTGTPDGCIFVVTKYGLNRKERDDTEFTQLFQLSGTIRSVQYHPGEKALYLLMPDKLYRYRDSRLDVAAESPLEDDLTDFCIGRSTLWVQSETAVWNVRTGRVYTNTELQRPALSRLLEDREGNLWLSTWAGVRMIVNHRASVLSQPSEIITRIQKHNGSFWVSGDNGITQLDSSSSVLKHLPLSFVEDFFIEDNRLIAFPANTLHIIRTDTWAQTEIRGSDVTSALRTKDGTLWIGSYDGLRVMAGDKKPALVKEIATAWCMLENDKGLWVGTEEGLYNFYRDAWTRYTTQDGLSHNSVWHLCNHPRWGLLVATSRGISRQAGHDKFELFAFSDRFIASLAADPAQRLWVATDKGIYRFSKDREADLFLNRDRGLPSNSPYIKSVLVDGEYIYFGTSKGLARIELSIKNDMTTGPMLDIGSINLNGHPVTSLGTLRHHQNNLTFYFNAIYTYLPNAVRYSYQLQGFDSVWKETPLGQAAYTNLKPGQYKFQVRAMAEAGKESPVRSVSFTILKPFWLEWWFIGLEIVVGLLFVALVAHLVSRYRIRQSESERARLQALYEKQIELDRLKDDFLANTSHELRTPLNGIIGITDSVLDGAAGEISPQIRENLVLVSSSGKRLLKLVNDILDFSKLREHEMVLEKQPVDLHQITETVLNLSQGLVGNKPVRLINSISPHLPMAWADSVRLEQVLYNLVGNAIKFTNDGHVKVSANLTPESDLEIQIEDTGIGIMAEKLAVIFEPFEQAEGHETRKFEGTGIGLSITKQIVDLHGGQIQVKSESGRGTTFIFTIPAAETEAEPKADTPKEAEVPVAEIITAEQEIIRERRIRDTGPPSGAPERRKTPYSDIGDIQVLAVDDEPTNLQVISNYLSTVNVSVTKALNGMEALDLIGDGLKPDCVLLDVMMPRMSGFEVCQKIRETFPAAELPVIILTAKNQVADLVKGFQAGASDYLTKPFIKDELVARIRTHTNLIRTVDRLVATTADREAMNRELEVARGIQTNFLPKDFFDYRPEFDLYATMEPARMVGGDLYDCFFIDDSRLCFAIGDVSDKGVPAALLMVTTRTLIKALADQGIHEPATLMSELNRILNWDNPRHMFVTLIVAILNLNTGEIAYSNAGHNPPIMDNNGTMAYLRAKSGPFVGPFPNLTYKPLSCVLNPGDLLFLYTDGVTEAMNPDKTEFAPDGLMQSMSRTNGQQVREVIRAVTDDVNAHAAGEPQSDDITMLAIRYNGSSETEV